MSYAQDLSTAGNPCGHGVIVVGNMGDVTIIRQMRG
jgi:hypothetical protein